MSSIKTYVHFTINFEGKASGEKYKIDMSVAPFSNRFPSMGLFSFTWCFFFYFSHGTFVRDPLGRGILERTFLFLYVALPKDYINVPKKDSLKDLCDGNLMDINVNSFVNMFCTQIN